MQFVVKSLIHHINFKWLQFTILIICGFLPWNATAINQTSFNNSFINNPLSKNNSHQDIIENLLVQSLIEITQGNTKQAMQTVNALIAKAPNFKLAYLIRGDLLTAQSQQIEALGNTQLMSMNKPISDEIEGLREEARTRVNHYFAADKHHQIPNIPIKMDASQKHLIVVDTAKSRLFLYQSTTNGLQYVTDYYVTIGKNGADKKTQGDKRTPVGVYFAGRKITTKLADLYGDAAYPLDYPNELDQKEKKTGNGIWLHGTPHDTYSRPPRASDGCVVLSNPDIKSLASVLDDGNTPVVISDKIEWVDSSQYQAVDQQLAALSRAIESWRKDWVSQNTDSYLKHYSSHFFYSDGNFQQWAQNKQRIQADRPKVSIAINNISMFGYPISENSTVAKLNGSSPIVVVSFEQDFKNAQMQNKMRKRQYWQNENNQWKIIYEGAE